MDRIILLIAALIVLYGSGCGDDLGYVEVPEADASTFIPEADASVPEDFCGDGTYFDEPKGECLPVYDDEEEDPVLPEPPHEEEDPELPPEEEEEPPACEEGEELVGEECLPIETPGDPEEPIVCEDDEELVEDGCVPVEEPNWVYLKSPLNYRPDNIQEVGDGCTVPSVRPSPSDTPSSRVHIVVRVDADDWSSFRYTNWVVHEQLVYVTNGWGSCKGWCLGVNDVPKPAIVSTTNPCEAD